MEQEDTGQANIQWVIFPFNIVLGQLHQYKCISKTNICLNKLQIIYRTNKSALIFRLEPIGRNLGNSSLGKQKEPSDP